MGRRLALAWGVLALLLVGPMAHAHRGHPPGELETVRKQGQAALAYLKRLGVPGDQAALLFYSTRHGFYYLSHRAEVPMPAASNQKLLTTHAALEVMPADFRWYTYFSRVAEAPDANGHRPWGLRVVTSGDPTLDTARLLEIGGILWAKGLTRIDAGIELRKRNQRHGGEDGPTPYIVNGNELRFHLMRGPGASTFSSRASMAWAEVDSDVKPSMRDRSFVQVEQDWTASQPRFSLRGHLPDDTSEFTIKVDVDDPRAHYHRQLVKALADAGIRGEMRLLDPSRGEKLTGTETRLFVASSLSLPETVRRINKESDNLAAEHLLRAMGRLLGHDSSREAALEVLMAQLETIYPDSRAHLILDDGSGLSEHNRLTAHYLVRLLNRARFNHRNRADFISSLSLAGVDGTLRFRSFPPAMRGNLRAKSGTLFNGVSNLSGYLQLERDVVVFSILLHSPGANYVNVQRILDTFLTRYYEMLLGLETQLEAPDGDPALTVK